MNALRRICLWFGSLFVSVTLFSLLFTLLTSGPGFYSVGFVLLVIRATMTFALPVWCLYLPIVIALVDAEGWRSWIIFSSGILIGPVSLGLWGTILQLRGADPQKIWHGDPLAFGLLGGMIFALIVGSLTTSTYVIALKVLHHRSTAAKERFT